MMKRIHPIVLLGCAVVTFSLIGIAFADEVKEADKKDVLCILPAKDNATSKKTIKKMSSEDCQKAGGTPATPTAIPVTPKPKD